MPRQFGFQISGTLRWGFDLPRVNTACLTVADGPDGSNVLIRPVLRPFLSRDERQQNRSSARSYYPGKTNLCCRVCRYPDRRVLPVQRLRRLQRV